MSVVYLAMNINVYNTFRLLIYRLDSLELGWGATIMDFDWIQIYNSRVLASLDMRYLGENVVFLYSIVVNLLRIENLCFRVSDSVYIRVLNECVWRL